MPIAFCGSSTPTVGVELEVMIVDQASGELVCAAHDVLEMAGRAAGAGGLDRVKPELFDCTIEITTDICGTVGEAREQLAQTLESVSEFLAPRGLALICAGLHPWARWQELTIAQDERHLRLVERLQWPARQLVSHGVHVHVAVPDGDTAIAVQNRIAGFLPLLLGLSASSPFREGMDSGLASARMTVMDLLPISGPPPRFEQWSEFEQFTSAMMASGTITSVRDVWWGVRPHADFGTVETRILDALPTLDEAAALAALTHCLVARLAADHAHHRSPDLLPDWVVRQNLWRATRYGLDADLIVDAEGATRAMTDLIEDALAEVGPLAGELGCERELSDVRMILLHGSSATRQRAITGSGGSLQEVVASLQGELRRGRPLDWS